MINDLAAFSYEEDSLDQAVNMLVLSVLIISAITSYSLLFGNCVHL